MCLFKCTLLIQILLSFTNSPFALCIRSKIQPNMKKQNYQNVLIKPKSREVIVYTQGTFIEDENGKKVVYVSGGLYGESNILKHDYETMALIKKTSLDSKYFAEGIVKIGDKIYQQTWKEESIQSKGRYVPAFDVRAFDIDMDFDFKLEDSILGSIVQLAKGPIKDAIKSNLLSSIK